LDDPTHSNPGYSTSYTNALAYTYGYPEDEATRSEFEKEILVENEARAQRNIEGYGMQTRYQQ